MPMYLDRHDGATMSPEDIAAAHVLDLGVQDAHGVTYHTYWFDPAAGTVFCLAEGPNPEALEAVHRESHGLLADLIVELAPAAPMGDFFGALPNHPAGEAYAESAMRAIVFTDMVGSVAQVHEHGDDGHIELLGEHDAIVREHIGVHRGREVKHTGDGIMASFNSSVSAVEFSSGVQRQLHERNQNHHTPFDVSIGICAGEPVTRGNDDLFGATVQIAARLCAAAGAGEVFVSSVVKDLCVGKKIAFDDRGELTLKGLPEPARVYSVEWRN